MPTGQSKSFHNLLNLVRSAEMSPTRRRDMLSAIERLCEMLGRSPAGVPLHVPELRVLLREIRPAAHRISGKTFANIRSLVAAAVALTGQLDGPVRGLSKGHPVWGPLMQGLSTDHALATGLAAFTNWCAAKGIAPGDVTDVTLQNFLAWLEKGTLHPRPRELARRVPNLWERARERVPGWPDRTLARLSFKLPSKRLSWSELSEAFRRDGEAYLERRKSLDLFDDSGGGPRRPLGEDTLRLQRDHLRLAASVLVTEGGIAVDRIISLACLTQPDAFKAILRCFAEQARRKVVENDKREGKAIEHWANRYPPNSFVIGLASTLVQTAKYHSHATSEEIQALKEWAARLTPVPFELAPKNAKLLRQLEPKAAQAKLLFLPERLLAEVAQDLKTGRLRLIDAQVAIAIDVVLVLPLRPQNLHALNWRRHFTEIDGSGHLLLHIPKAETKSGRMDIVAEVPQAAARRLNWYRRKILPLLGGDPNGDLFVARGGTRKHQETLSGQIIDRIARHVGVHMTPHQFRHFAAVFYLDENPGDFETVRALLGHAVSKTTLIYAGSSTRRSGRAYGRFLFERREELRLCQSAKGRRAVLRKKGDG
jgi:integrase